MALTEAEELELLELEEQAARAAIKPQDNRGKLRKFYDVANTPARMAESGISQLADFIPEPLAPTGNLAADVAMGAPSILTKSGIKATGKIAASQISPESVLTAFGANLLPYAAKPAGAVLRGLSRQAEDVSGIAPKAAGALEATFKDPTLLFAKGKKAAQPLYEAAKGELDDAANVFRTTGVKGGVATMEKTQNLFKGMYEPKDILDKANAFLEGGGSLTPAEALTARKALDKMLKSKRYVEDELIGYRDIYDKIAKSSKNIAEADPMHKRGIQAEAMRKFLPQNKGGGVSPFRVAEGMALAKMIPGGQYLAAPLLMPIVQGGLAAGVGTLAKPVSALTQVLKTRQGSGSILALLRALAERQQVTER